MLVLVTVEAVVVGLLALLVVALLRSHAEILRRLDAPEATWAKLPDESELGTVREAVDIAGTSLSGERISVPLASGRIDHPALLTFLTTGCSTCENLWAQLRDPRRVQAPPGVQVYVLAKDKREESIARLRKLSGEIETILSSTAWSDYKVPGSPYFMFIDRGEVRGQGSADTWSRAVSLCEEAIADAAADASVRPGPVVSADTLAADVGAPG